MVSACIRQVSRGFTFQAASRLASGSLWPFRWKEKNSTDFSRRFAKDSADCPSLPVIARYSARFSRHSDMIYRTLREFLSAMISKFLQWPAFINFCSGTYRLSSHLRAAYVRLKLNAEEFAVGTSV